MVSKSIIEMALEAGVEVTYDPTETPLRAFAECWIEDLERFADLIRADEREACARFVEEGYVRQFENPWREDLAAAIRARGNT